MEEERLVFPGEHLFSCEEFEPGQNTFCREDESYSSAFGKVEINEGTVLIKRRDESLRSPKEGTVLFCLVRRADPHKARLECIMESEAEGKDRGPQIDAVLPVANISRSHVGSVRDAIRVGDVLKARIGRIKDGGEIEISLVGKDFGVIKAFCTRCRHSMQLKTDTFICDNCGRTEKRKIPGDNDPFSRGGHHHNRGRDDRRRYGEGRRPGGNRDNRR
jgi:exosome complex component CSL4